jgi:hypothetical protein
MDSEHCFLGGHRMRSFCRDLIGRCAPYLPVIVVLQKPGLITGHDTTEADSPLALDNSEQLSCELDSLLAQFGG